ncbi:unnamed protein product [Adineta steineri]|uniref:Uncharacterized protein n=2 Tax=Adineta steineri TaxID=433720 RepID=A0A819IYS2_9BILA|nr:unnamed protein product [Adineta steineri]
MPYERSSSLYRSNSGEDGYGFAYPGTSNGNINGNYLKFDTGPTAGYGMGSSEVFMNGTSGATFHINGNADAVLNGLNGVAFHINGNGDGLANGHNGLAFHFGGNSDGFVNGGGGQAFQDNNSSMMLHNSSNSVALHNSSKGDAYMNGGTNAMYGHSDTNGEGYFGAGTYANGSSGDAYGHSESSQNGNSSEAHANSGTGEQFLNGVHTEIFLNDSNNSGAPRRESRISSFRNGPDQSGYSAASFTNGNGNDYSSGNSEKQASTAGNYPTDAQGLYQDPNPQILRRPAIGGPQVYTQRVIVKFLQAPPMPPPGPLIIKEIRAPQPPPPPPLFIRQRPPPPPILPPLIIREAPPKLPPLVGPQVITKMLPPLPVPPRSVIIERLPPLPPRPRDVIVERWLPYRTLQKRRVIIQRAPPAVIPKPRNIIIYYEPAKAQIVRRFQNLGVAPANPDEYVARYGSQLEDSQTLISHARQAGVIEDISPPISMRSSFQSASIENAESSEGGGSTAGNDLSDGNSAIGAGSGAGGGGGGGGGYGVVNSGAGAASSSSYDSISTNNTLGRNSGSTIDLESFGFADHHTNGFGGVGGKILKKADRIRQLNTENNSQEKIDIYHEAGEACRSIGNYDKAIIYFNLELHEAQLANLHDDILYSHRFLGECYLYKNEFYTSEKYHLKFLSLAKSYNDNERIEQAYTCLANTYWLWLSYLQDDMLYDSEYDQFPRDLCKRSFDAATNSLIIIEKLDYQLDIDIKEKRLIKIKDIEEQQQDLALRRVRSYINIGKYFNKIFHNEKQTTNCFYLANALSEKYLHDGKDNEHLKDFSKYIKKAVELSKKYNLYEELTRIHSSVSVFYLSVPNYLQYKQEILATMKQAIYYAQLTKKANEYLSCLYDIAQTLVSFDDYDDAKMYLVKISQYKITDHAIKEKAMQDLINVQRILTGLEDRYEKEDDLQKKMSLAEKCADTYSCLDRNERSKYYYLKQLKHAQELNLNEDQMATIYSSLGSIYQDLKEWQLSIDYFRREMSCRIGLGIQADIEQGYSLCEIIKCEYRLKIDVNSRIRTFNRLLTIVRSTNNTSLIRTAIALVFAMKQRDSLIYLNEELEEFIANIQPPITKENYNEILRYSERNSNESIQSDDEQNELDNTHDSTNRLHLACKEKNGLTQVIQFISEGDNINLSDCHGWTPLHIAVDHENIDIIRYLLNHKANINAKTNNGITPLINACYQGYFDTIELLLTYSARIDIRTNNGYTAVDYLFNYDKNLTSIDQRKLNRFKQLFLVTIRNNEPNYSIQKIIQNDFERLTNINNRIDYSIITNKRLRQTNKKNKFSIVKYECDEESEREQPDSPLYTPAPKRKCTMIDNEHLISDLIEIDHFDFVKSLQLITPKSTVRSRQASTTSSLNTTIVLSPPPLPT